MSGEHCLVIFKPNILMIPISYIQVVRRIGQSFPEVLMVAPEKQIVIQKVSP